MNDLADYKRANNKKYVKDFLEGILDVIETDYPDKYFMMFEDHTQVTTLFSNEEWIDILTKSRNSFSCHIKRINLTEKRTTRDNRAEIGRLIMLNSHFDRSKAEK
ncbi:hypothetical protein [Desulfosporosinus sp. OT]|uniref:hypothetical protein n=1 Tax=Desulfosporosinus sp. OT TaxID=913865 RepID=UPI000223B2A1|nr:hypothetical protein [Desulfosporosinus sp. OT]EGW37391.1 hypothetical protein DOT_4375 [Desulfosporosinus sp. OT]